MSLLTSLLFSLIGSICAEAPYKCLCSGDVIQVNMDYCKGSACYIAINHEIKNNVSYYQWADNDTRNEHQKAPRCMDHYWSVYEGFVCMCKEDYCNTVVFLNRMKTAPSTDFSLFSVSLWIVFYRT
ncbi:hypothetical protein L596_020016 [Steinernema carpocapsae]|uniref:Protein sleepless n=1 Tax=Steinernema carpocapsae TaxID=34508 RepID=A0A4V6A0R9_STECR|nr:hypothetical protein L596_020016 [Steinernema carpocapsae]